MLEFIYATKPQNSIAIEKYRENEKTYSSLVEENKTLSEKNCLYVQNEEKNFIFNQSLQEKIQSLTDTINEQNLKISSYETEMRSLKEQVNEKVPFSSKYSMSKKRKRKDSNKSLNANPKKFKKDHKKHSDANVHSLLKKVNAFDIVIEPYNE